MNAVEDVLRQTLLAHEVRDYDATNLLARVREEVESPQRHPQAAKPTGPVIIAAAATVLVLVGTGWWIWTRGEPTNREPAPAGQVRRAPSTTLAPMPTAPFGTKIVGYRGIMLTLPGKWATVANCGQAGHRILRFPTDPPVSNCPYFRRHSSTGVVSFYNSTVGPPGLLGKTVPGREIGGVQVRLTDVIRLRSLYDQALAVPSKQFYVDVFAPRRALVNRIIKSARAVPAGYTAVPEVVGSRKSSAIRQLTAAGLRPSKPKPPLVLCCPVRPVRVAVQHPAAGSVVRVGTRFSLSPR